jgi:hypothetical protein
MDLLRSVRSGNSPKIGNSVIVIGGGNVAVDAAITCKRLGGQEVKIVCLEDRDEMPAFDDELMEAQEEGIIFENCLGPERFEHKNGKVIIHLNTCNFVYDQQGIFNPSMNSEMSCSFEADTIVVAIGQKRTTFNVDSTTLKSFEHENIFACGDIISGPSSVVDAMAHGREAANSINLQLKGQNLLWNRNKWLSMGFVKEYAADNSRSDGVPRQTLNRYPIKKRNLIEEVNLCLSQEKIKIEADRCISCGRAQEWNETCWFCLPCEIDCPNNALEVKLPYLIR